MKNLVLPMAVLATTLLHAGCAGGTVDAPASHTAAPSSISGAAVVAALRDAGLELRDGGMVEQPFFSVPAHVYLIEGRDLQLYEFASEADAEQAAARVAPSGSPIGTTMVTWMARPHFFRKGRLIVNYVGTSERVLSELQRLLGPQFAGR